MSNTFRRSKSYSDDEEFFEPRFVKAKRREAHDQRVVRLTKREVANNDLEESTDDR